VPDSGEDTGKMFRFLHHIGTFLLFAATIFLVITSITSPVVNNIGLLTVNLPNAARGSEISFGSWGYCIQDGAGNGRDDCTNAQVGYNPATVMREVDGTDFSDYAENTAKALTRVMVLHPVAAGLSFIAFFLAMGAGVVGSFLASLVASVAFIVTLVVLVCDFVGLGIIKSNVNNERNGRLDSNAYFSAGMWCVLVAAICNFLAAIIVFLTCCTGRVKSRREHRKVEATAVSPRRRRFFWQRRARV